MESLYIWCIRYAVPFLILICVHAAEGKGKSRKLSITLCKQPAAAAAAAPVGGKPKQYAVWSSLLLVSGDAQKSPDKHRDQLAAK